MARRPRIENVQLGTGTVPASVPVPRVAPGLIERCGLRWSGFVDRFRLRIVPDSERTHYLHRLEHAIRRREADVVRVEENAISRLRVMVQRAIFEADQAIPPTVDEPTAHDLEEREGADRVQWVREVRAAREAAEAARAAAASAAAARVAVVTLREEERGIRAEALAIRSEWRESFETRAALYERARHGVWGRQVTSTPTVVQYRPTQGPRPAEDDDLLQPSSVG
ncbi:hypothetical protein [Rathayibacter sp. Leaf296]|uniref:hypothetical protein n=1 Tax=Rathayibacter sp. Leaf296 TaxID=1736327 RepID=UPI000702CED6|nr:hypothetical protein [Rathayibacter sp. Leaf296]KQQ09772.1 hypothetical protein ASF46_01210 [Rathayibacter sp. Leaf296]